MVKGLIMPSAVMACIDCTFLPQKFILALFVVGVVILLYFAGNLWHLWDGGMVDNARWLSTRF